MVSTVPGLKMGRKRQRSMKKAMSRNALMYSGSKLKPGSRKRLERIYKIQSSHDLLVSKIQKKYGSALQLARQKYEQKMQSEELVDAEEEKVKIEEPKPKSVVKQIPLLPEVSRVPKSREVEKSKTPPSSDRIATSSPYCVRMRKELTRFKKGPAVNSDVNWISMINFNQRVASLEEKRMDSLEKQNRARFKRELDSQKARKIEERKKEEQAKSEYQRELNNRYRKWKQEQSARQEEARRKILQLKYERRKELEKANELKKAQAIKKKQREEREMKRIKKALALEKKRQDEKRKKHKETMIETLKDNLERRHAKEKQRQLEQEEAVRLMQEYAKLLEKQEAEKKRLLEETYAQQEQKITKLLEATEDAREQEKADWLRAEKEQRELIERENLKAKKSEEWRKRLQQQCNDFVLQQRELKKKRRAVEEQELEKYKKFMKDDVEAYKAENAAKAKKSREKLEEQARFLEEQIKHVEKRKFYERAELSETEAKMNSHLLTKVKSNSIETSIPEKITSSRPYAWKFSRPSALY